MSKVTLGVVCGFVFGSLAVAGMLPMTFPDKTAALAGAFINRFSIGFVIGCVRLAWPGWLVGPILGMGTVGGLIIGVVVQKWGK